MNRQIRVLSLIGLCAVLAFQQAATALAQNGPPPKDRYIIVLKPAKTGVPELTDHDITAGGGKVEYKVPGRIQVTLPEQAVDAIRKHGGVKYIQKVILGPVPDASAPAELRMTPTTSSLRVASEATPPTWKSGTYQYDASGNIYGIGGVAGDGSTMSHRYAYDELSRLRQSDTITATTQTQTFTYDPYGNLTQRQIVGLDPVLTPVETPNTNRLLPVSGHPYTYDAAGNLTADYNLAYAYDPFNMLREKDSGIYFSKSEFYIYTASDERIGVKYGNVIESPTIWSIRDFSGNVLRQYEGYDQMPGMSWLWIEDYMYRDGQLLAGERVREEGGRRHFHLDHLGSPRLVTGDDSKEMSEHDYEPFGMESTNPLYQETAGGFDREDPKRFTGHERDYASPGESPASTAYLDYMHARFYSSNVGRFLSVDPLQSPIALTAPQNWNRYTYGANNPLKFVDPNGKANTIYILSLLPDTPNWYIRESVDEIRPYTSNVTNYKLDGRYGLSMTDGLAGFARADSTDYAILESHGGGPNFQSELATGARETFTDRDVTSAIKRSGDTPAAVILSGCSTQEAAKHINEATGAMTFGTTAAVHSNEGARAAAVLATALAATHNVKFALKQANRILQTPACAKGTACAVGQFVVYGSH